MWTGKSFAMIEGRSVSLAPLLTDGSRPVS
jgi:hypothetical protein